MSESQPAEGSHPSSPRYGPAAVALSYFLLGSLWIATSDALLGWLVGDAGVLATIGAIKGFAFIGITSGVLYLLLHRAEQRPAPSAKSVLLSPRQRRTALAVFVLALALVPPLFGYGVARLHYPQMERDVYANLGAIARLKVNQILFWLDGRQRDASGLAANPGFAERVASFLSATDPAAEDLLRRQLRSYIDTYGYTAVALFDRQGQGRLGAGNALLGDTFVVGQLTEDLAEQQVMRTPLYQDADGHIHLNWLVPIRDPRNPEHGPIAIVVLQDDPDQLLYPLIQTWPVASTSAETLLVRREGDDVLFLNALRFDAGAALSRRHPLASPDLPAALALRSAEAGLTAGLDYRGEPVYAAYRPVMGTSWWIIAKIDQKEAQAASQVLVFWISLVVFLALLALGVMLRILWRQQERNQALALQAQAEESDRLLHQFFELPFVGMAITSAETRRWVRFNDRLCEILGYPREEVAQLTWTEITHPDDLTLDVAEFERVLRGESDGYRMDRSEEHTSELQSQR